MKNVDVPQLEEVIKAAGDKKFRFVFEGINKKVQTKRQMEIVEIFNHLPFDPKLVDLSNYQQVYKIIDNAEDGKLFFGNRVAFCRETEEAETFYAKYNLKLRPYLGPTSTDHELALLMAN